MKKYFLLALLLYLGVQEGFANDNYWQQHVDYTMRIDFDHTKHQFVGEQSLVYTNNSPHTLTQVYYHLYFNAFQPGSAMDVRSRTIADPDRRIRDRIAELTEEEIGYHKINSLKQDGKSVTYEVQGTLLIVELAKPVAPGKSAKFDMKFESQVPVQIRRSGRNNAEGVDYTMTQWYPKMAEYDGDGWHTDPYVGREFHGVFGSFDVTINIADEFVVGGTGEFDKTQENGKNIWQSKVDNVHDFAWAADPDFVHKMKRVDDDLKLHFYYLNDTAIAENWTKLEDQTVKLFEIMNEDFGRYPYESFSVIQGGDGGMEYPLCTMISGTGSFGGLVSVTVHEAIHNWYYGVLATHELKYPWMDEGFTTYAQNIVLDSLRERGNYNPHTRSYRSYIRHVNGNDEEPLTTHADHYHNNAGYGVASYSKGCVFLNQLRYIVGDEVFQAGMKTYFDTWKFKHPTPKDFKRVMELQSGIELDWYFESWIGTSKQIDYRIVQMVPDGNQTKVIFERVGELPMPLDIRVESSKGRKDYHIPLQKMLGHKALEGSAAMKPWVWTYPYYEMIVDSPIEAIESISIDPKLMMADVNRSDNTYPRHIDDTLIDGN